MTVTPKCNINTKAQFKMNHQPTSQRFIFENVWPILKIAQIIGVFPYKKVKDDYGNFRLEPMNKCLSILRFTLSFTAYMGLNMGFVMSIDIPGNSSHLEIIQKASYMSETGVIFTYCLVAPVNIVSQFFIAYGGFKNDLHKLDQLISKYIFISINYYVV